MSTLPEHLEKQFQDIMSWKPSQPRQPRRARPCEAKFLKFLYLLYPESNRRALKSFNIIFIKFIKAIKFILHFLSQKTALKLKTPHFHWLPGRWIKLKIIFTDGKNIKIPNWIFAFILLLILAGPTYYLLSQPKLNYNPYFVTAPKNSPYNYQNKNDQVNILVGSKDKPNIPSARFEVANNRMVEFVAENQTAQQVKVEGNKLIRYQDVQPNTDITYEIQPNSLKENIIFKKPLSLKPTNLSAGTDPGNSQSNSNSISFIMNFPKEIEIKENLPNVLTFYEKNGGYLFNFPKPYLIDAKGIRSESVKIKVNRVVDPTDGNKIMRYRISFTPDSAWLNDTSRQYPVILDPTIIHDTSAVFATGTFNRLTDLGSGFYPQLSFPYRTMATDAYTAGLWHFDESSGVDVGDSSGNGNTGLAVGTFVVNGKSKNARMFNGTSDYIKIKNSSSLNITGDKTVEAWIKPNDVTNTQRIVSHWGDANAEQQYLLQLDGDSAAGFHTENGTNQCDASGGNLTAGQWYYLTGVKSGGNCYLYINGQLAGSESVTNIADQSVTTDIRIGHEGDGSSTAYYNGIIDELRISNTARSFEEINNYYNFANRLPYGTYTSPVIDFGQTPASLNTLTWIDDISPPDTPAGWTKVKTIFIDNTQNPSTLTNYPVKVHIDYDSNMKSDFADLLFTDINGTSYSYWIETKSDGVEAEVWVKLDTIAGSSQKKIFLFYGNSSATTTSSGTNTFTFFDDFDSLGAGWSATGAYSTGNSQLTITTGSIYSKSTVASQPGYITEAKIKWNDLSNNTGGLEISNATSVVANNTASNKAVLWGNANASTNINGWAADGTAASWNIASSITQFVGTTSPTYILSQEVGTTSVSFYKNRVLTNTYSGTFSGAYYLILGSYLGSGGGTTNISDVVYDWVLVRQKAAIEPVANVGANIEFQTRTSADNSTWEEWKPLTGESSIDSLDGPYQYNTTDVGLTAYWPLDETANDQCTGGSNDVCDKKSNYDGAAAGTTITSYSKFGKARYFGSTSNYVNMGNVLDFERTDTFSFASWFKTTYDTSYTIQSFISKRSYDPNPVGYAFGLTSTGNVAFALYNLPTGQAFIQTDQTYRDGNWHYAVATNSGAGDTSGMKIYVDGLAVANSVVWNTLGANSIKNANLFNLGAQHNSGSFQGYLDEVRVYNTTLSASTVYSLFQQGIDRFGLDSNLSANNSPTIKMEGSGSEKITVGAPVPNINNTIGLWHLDENGSGVGMTFYDSSSYGNNGIGGSGGVATSVPTLTNGYYQMGRSFDGSDDVINAGSPSVYTDLSALTVSAWIYPLGEGESNAGRIVDKADPDATNRGWFFSLANGVSAGIQFNAGCLGTTLVRVSNANSIAHNQWQHVAVTWDGSLTASNVHLYVNGVEVTYKTTTNGTTGKASDSSCSLRIGNDKSGTKTFNGTIDEVQISNRVLTANEIAEAYRSGQGYRIGTAIPPPTDLSNATKIPFYIASDRPNTHLETYIGESAPSVYDADINTVGLWHMEEVGGSNYYILDSSGNINHGKPTGTSLTDGKIGKSRSFDGSSYIMLTSTPTTSTGSYSISAWVKTADTGNRKQIVAYGSDTADTGEWFFISNTNKVESDLSSSVGPSSSVTVTDGNWHYVAVVNNANVFQIYVDGVASGSSASMSPNIGTGNSAMIGSGMGAHSSDYRFIGNIDEVMISNIARSAAEIQQEYQYGLRTHPITIDFVTNPQAAYSSGTSMTINNPTGTSRLTDTLSVGDTIIVRENENGTEYISQSQVTAIINTSSTYGTVTLATALASIPPSGFTTNAAVFKWQREYWDLNDISPQDRNTINQLGVRVLDASQGFNFWLDDFRYNSNYLYQPFGNTISSTTNRYFQYRAILTNNNGGPPTLSRATVNYTLTPDEKDNRPVAQWKFDEGYGTTAYDETIGNHDAILNGMSASVWVDGVIGKGLSFSGSPQYLSVPNSADVNFGTHPMSISAFVKTNASGGNGFQIINKYSTSSSSGYDLWLGSDGKINFRIASLGSSIQLIGNRAVNDNLWHNIVAVRDASGMKTYIDGVFDSSNNNTVGNIDCAADIYIGKNNTSAGYDFKGIIDELELYDYGLSAAQAKTVSNKSANAVAGAPESVAKGGSAPMGFWKFNEGTGTTANDSSGNGNNLSFATGNSAPTWTKNGKVGSALSFDGNDYVSVNNAGLNLANNFTMETWLKISDTTRDHIVMAWGENVTGKRRSMWVAMTTGYLNFSGYAANITSTKNVADGLWHHAAITVDSGNLATVYVDGISVASGTPSLIAYTYGGTYIGSNPAGLENTNGVLDQVKIYNYVRSVAQIHADMDSGPVSWWKFDEGYGTTVYDEMKNNNGTFATGNSAPTWTDGKYGKALNFTTNQYLSIGGTVNSLQTITFWANPGSTATSFIGLNSTAAVVLSAGHVVANGFGTPTIYVNGVGSTAVSVANQWVHIAVVTNGTVVANSITIGKSGTGYYGGKIDEVKIYNYPLTADEIKVDYNQSSALRLGNPIDINNGGSGPLGYWKFDEGTGTSAYDTSGNGNNGTLGSGTSTPTWTDNGKVGSALNFDGSNDYVKITDTTNSPFDITNGLTLSAWIKPSAWVAFGGIISKGDAGQAYSMETSGTGQLQFEYQAGSGFYDQSNSSMTLNAWNFATITFDGSNVRFYINGVLDKTVAGVGNFYTNNDPVTIGVDLYGGDEYFNGLIDQVKIYNYARTQKQIMEDMNGGKPVAYWKMDEKTGSIAYDDSDNNNDGAYGAGANAPTPGIGKIGWSLNFDGVNSVVTVPDSNSLDMTSDVTISAWVSCTGSGEYYNTIIKKEQNYIFRTGGACDALHAFFWDGTNTRHFYQNASLNIPSGWHYVAVVINSQDYTQATLYLDGIGYIVSDSTASQARSLNNVLTIGQGAGTEHFKGSIDEVKIYNYALTPNEIKLDYNSGAVSFK